MKSWDFPESIKLKNIYIKNILRIRLMPCLALAFHLQVKIKARTCSISSIGGGKISYTFGVGLANKIALALILCIPDVATLTIHLLCLTLAINICSAYDNFLSCSGIPNQSPFARALRGSYPFSRCFIHCEQTPEQLKSLTGPDIS